MNMLHRFRGLADILGISKDVHFIRTTDDSSLGSSPGILEAMSKQWLYL
jgi:hypothetical protein